MTGHTVTTSPNEARVAPDTDDEARVEAKRAAAQQAKEWALARAAKRTDARAPTEQPFTRYTR